MSLNEWLSGLRNRRVLSSSRSSRRRKRSKPLGVSAAAESLENRTLLSAQTIILSAGQLTITGTDETNAASVEIGDDGRLHASLKTGLATEEADFAVGEVTSIQFIGLDGDDTFRNKTDIPTTADGGLGNDLIIAGGGSDQLTGGDGNDTVVGGGGNDTIHGNAGADKLHGSQGTDTIDGGIGNDFLSGGAGVDTLSGGDGDDELRAGIGNDTLDGGAGNNKVVAAINVTTPPGDSPDGTSEGSALNAILSAENKQAIRDGLNSLISKLNETTETGSDAARSVLAFTLSEGLINKVNTYLDDANATAEGLANILRNLSSISPDGLFSVTVDAENISVTANTEEIRFALRVQATRVDSASLAELTNGILQEISDNVQVNGQLQVTNQIDLQLAFGVDLTITGGSAADRFFVEVTNAAVDTRIEAEDLDLPISISFIGAEAFDGFVRLNSRAAVSVTNSTGGTRIYRNQLAAANLSGSLTGGYHIELPVSVSVGSFSRQTVITAVNDDLSISDLPDIDFGDLNPFGGGGSSFSFSSINKEAILNALKKLKNKLADVAKDAVLDTPLPFAKSVSVADAIQIGDAFSDQILDQLTKPGANGDLIPDFNTAQEFAEKLAIALGVDPSEYGTDIYNPETQELTFAINFSKAFQQAIDLALEADIAGVAEFQLGSPESPNPQLVLTSNISGSFVFKVNLNADAEVPFSVEQAEFEITVSATANNIDGSARIGAFGIDLVDGSASVNFTVGATAANLTDLDNFSLTPTLSGSASANLPVQLAADIEGITLPTGTSVSFDFSDITNPGGVVANLTSQIEGELDGLLDSLEAVAVAHVIDGIEQLVDFLKDVQSNGIFQQKIPIVGQSLSDLLDISERLDALAQELDQNPPATIDEALDRINQLLDSVSVNFSVPDRVLEFDLNYAFDKSTGVDLSFDLDDSLGAGVLEDFVTVSASAPIEVAISGTAALGLVIDLGGSGPLFAIKDSSQVQLGALINAADIDLEASIGPLGIFVENGRLHLDNGTIGQAATLTVGLEDGVDSRHTLGSALGAVDVNFAGRLEAELPVAFPTRDNALGPIGLSVGNLEQIVATTTLTQPDFSQIIASFDLSNALDLIVEGFDEILGRVQKGLEGRDLPLIGEKLSEVTGFLRDIREKFVSTLENVETLTQETIQQAIFEAFGPGGLDILKERLDDLDDLLTVEDVKLDLITAAGLLEEITYDFDLVGDYSISQPIDLDLGLDGLGLEIDADLHLDVDYEISVGFGINREDGFFITTETADGDPEFEISVEATLSDPASPTPAQVTADLFFLEFTATDQQVTREDGTISRSYFAGTFSIDLTDPGQNDGRLTLSELSSLADAIDVNLDATAHVALGLEAGVGSSTGFPRLAADFELLWQFDTSDPNLDGSIQRLGFNNVRLNLNDFVANTLNPVLGKINDILSPIAPIAQKLSANIPFLATLRGTSSYSLLDLARDLATNNDIKTLFGGTGSFSESTIEFVDRIATLSTFHTQVQELFNTIGSGFVSLGDLKLDAASALNANNLGKLTAATGSGAGSELDSTDQGKLQEFKDKTGFSLPVLQNPGQLFGLLLGQDIDLATFDLPKLDFEFGFEKFFPIVGPLGVSVAGSIGASADLQFGFNTAGLRQFADGGFESPELILNGLYISDTLNGEKGAEDIPELEVFGRLSASAEINAGIFSIGGGGALVATFEADLHDPNQDGRLYVQELVGGFDSGGIGGLFDFSGNVTAELYVYAEALFLRYEKTLADFELFSFSETPDPAPALGTVAGGTLTLNLNDGADDNIVITAGQQPGDVVVTSYTGGTTVSETFTGISHIVGNGGLGNDSIRIDGSVKATVDLSGGDGNDTLEAGGGEAVLRGGQGNDTLTATIADADLFGEAGDDVLKGGSGIDLLEGGSDNDALEGGAGNDTLRGGQGLDILFGGAGDDRLEGGANEDALDGGIGVDLLLGGDANDLLKGGDGNDILQGEAGNNTLEGEAGNDLLQGGVGNDTLDGGRDDDRLEGGAGIDELFGGLGADLLFGDLDNDRLEGGLGNDKLFGGAGDDTLKGNAGNDELSGEDGSDFLFGGDGDDLLFGYLAAIGPDGQITGNNTSPDGDDQLFGEAGNDRLFGGQGDDRLEGGTGSDVLKGQQGKDRLVYNIALNDPTSVDDLSGGTDFDSIVIEGTENADDLRVRQLGPGRFIVERREPGTDNVTHSFEFTLPENITDRDIEVLDLSGLGGNDFLQAIGAFNVNQVRIDGGTENDTILGSDGDDLLLGREGDDLIHGGLGEDELQGEEGNDELHGEAGIDALFGGSGNDELFGGAGFDIVLGGAGDDYLEASDDLSGDVLFGDGEDGNLGGNDTIIGGAGIDVIFGGGGNDFVDGRGLGDIINGDAGDDSLIGGTGRDFIDGGQGNDKLYANSTDLLAETEAPDQQELEELQQRLLGREIEITGFHGTVDGQPIDIDGELELNLVEQASVEDQINALPVGDPIRLELETRLEQLVAEEARLRLERTAIQQAQTDLDPEQTLVTDVLLGQGGNDEIYGSFNADKLIGGSGDDIIVHSAGNDFVFGGSDTDDEGNFEDDSELDEYRVIGTEQVDVIQFEIREVTGGSPEVFVTINDISTLASRLGIEVAGVLALGGNDEVTTIQLGQNAGLPGGFYIEGGSGNDKLYAGNLQAEVRIFGGEGNDTITGGKSKNFLHGENGDDQITGGEINDIITGGEGNDTLLGGIGIDSLDGGAGNDTLDGGADGDTLDGGAGNDTLDGGADGDTLNGGADDDTLIGGAGQDAFNGGAGHDRLYEIPLRGVKLSDTALTQQLHGFDPGITESLSSIEHVELTTQGTQAVIDASAFSGFTKLDAHTAIHLLVLYAGQGGSHLIGSAGSDQLYGGNGDDVIEAGDGSDRVTGGLGNNTIDAGHDIYSDQLIENLDVNFTLYNNALSLTGGYTTLSGIETVSLTGGAGNNIINAYSFTGQTTLNGGDGNDTIYGSNTARDYIYGGNGEDYLYSYGGDDSIYGEGGSDRIYGGNGNDTLHTGNGFVTDYLYGGAGNDTLYAAAIANHLYGEDGDDRLHAQDATADNRFYGGYGNDYLYGSYFVDLLDGGEGNDRLYGYGGNDTLYGQGGNDYLYGGDGNDYLNGGYGNDFVYGENGNDTLASGGGSYDYLFGGNGNDVLYGSNYTTNYLYGDGGDDYIYGGNYADYLYGSEGTDRLYGYGGNDYLHAGYDNVADYLYGGDGYDSYVTYYYVYSYFNIKIRPDSISDSTINSHYEYRI